MRIVTRTYQKSQLDTDGAIELGSTCGWLLKLHNSPEPYKLPDDLFKIKSYLHNLTVLDLELSFNRLVSALHTVADVRNVHVLTNNVLEGHGAGKRMIGSIDEAWYLSPAR